MNKMFDPQKLIAGVSLIPESAPFNTEQRAWLNGFFAGMTGIEEMMAQGSGGAATAARRCIADRRTNGVGQRTTLRT